jgi:2-succinyl-5-enolpyruvyl-6-hydroxy-3-cyclohexene-1-carboxylate synthase
LPRYLALVNTALLQNLIELCAKKGVRQAVICPGSRSAPLTLAFTRNKNIKCRTFSDERSAAFIALGIAQQSQSPVALVCTSGSAAYNFAPAVAEAYFQQIPLIVFTADRPTEWIDQLDGQTIRQKELYGNHVKKYFELPLDSSHPDAEWHANRIINEAINLAQADQKGPVQINAPFREPLYPPYPAATPAEIKNVRIIEALKNENSLSEKEWSSLQNQLSGIKRILIVSGQNEPSSELTSLLGDFISKYHWPIAGDILSNLHTLPDFCSHTDTFLAQLPETEKKSLQPDLLITFGKSLLSKNLKLFLRKYAPREHWHIQTTGDAPDTFQSLTRIIPVTPAYFFKTLSKVSTPSGSSTSFKDGWRNAEKQTKEKITAFFQKKRPAEFELVKDIFAALPSTCNLHLANSMTVRYANHIGLTSAQKDIAVFSNRGTSGIDGCSSTAVGHALSSDRPNVLITGDLAFFYDRNAFWHNYPLPNLFIVVLNNHGGIIFNLIDGPAGLPEAEEFFITRQQLSAKALAFEFGYSYTNGASPDLKEFFKSSGNVKILELESSQSQNKEVFEEFKKQINQRYES